MQLCSTTKGRREEEHAGNAVVSNGNSDECSSAAINIQLTVKDLRGKVINSQSEELFFFLTSSRAVICERCTCYVPLT